MSPLSARALPFVNTTLLTNTIAAIISTTTAATRTSTSTATTTVNGQMREEAMDVVVAKIISLLVLTILSVLCGLLPLRLLVHTPHLLTRSRSSVDYFLCCLRLFSGGIYMATCFLHLMPDTREKISAVMLNLGSKTSYAVPELLIMSGFYSVIFVEQIIQVLYVKAQESDVDRNQKMATKSKSKSDTECKRAVQTIHSTIDEESSRDNRECSDDDDDDDEYNNVLIDDEDDLSFKDTDYDRKSLDSVTQMKEGVLEQPFEAAKTTLNRHAQLTQFIPTHCNNISVKSQLPQHQHNSNHSKPCSYGDISTNVLMAISRSSLDALSKSHCCDVKPYYLTSEPPVIHTQVQQMTVLNSLKQNYHIRKHQSNNINHSQQNHRQHNHHDNQINFRSPSPPAPQQPHSPFHPMQQPRDMVQQFSPQQRDSPIPRSELQYPTVSQSSDEDSADFDEESETHNNACRVTVCADGVDSFGGDNSPGDLCQDRDEDSGGFTNIKNGDISEPRLLAHASSKEVSFDGVSETSSGIKDIQVKHVFDHLSRMDNCSRAHCRSIIYIMALSFHGIFEGMALGLQSMKSSTWSLCFAIVVHRCVLAFKLGMDLCRGEEKQGTTFVCIGIFTLISTLGIIIGILISSGASLYSDVTVPEAILQSLATGTIFYIVFFDILFKDLEGKEYLKRVSCSFVGFSVMAIVFAITRS